MISLKLEKGKKNVLKELTASCYRSCSEESQMAFGYSITKQAEWYYDGGLSSHESIELWMESD